MTHFGMFTAAGNRLVSAYVERALQRDWPFGTSLSTATVWVQEQVAINGADINELTEDGDRWKGAAEVYDTACRESIADFLEAAVTA